MRGLRATLLGISVAEFTRIPAAVSPKSGNFGYDALKDEDLKAEKR